MSSDFYLEEGSGVSAADMDPLGTAAASQQTGTGTTGEPVIGQLKGAAAGKKKAKQSMSTTKKAAIAFGAVVVAAGALTMLGGGQAPAPKMGHPPPMAIQPQAGTQAPQGMIAAQGGGEGAMVMGGDGNQAAVAVQAPTMNSQNPGGAPMVQGGAAVQAGVPQTAAAAPPPAPVAPAASSAGPKQPPALAQKQGLASVSNSAGWDQSKSVPDNAGQPAVASPENAKLAERVADLERKLAKLEQGGAVHAPTTPRAAANDIAPPSHRAKVQRLARAAVSSPAIPISRQLPAASGAGGTPQAGALVSLDNVHVIGTTTRQGVTTALLSMGSTNKRVVEGEVVPGLGTVAKIGTDAAGNAYAEINGVKYQ